LILVRGEKRSFERKKSVGHCAESGVVVETAPCSTFIVIEAEFLLHLLVVTFDTPSQLGQAHQRSHRRLFGERR
jgi:hypothetical protein